MLSVIKVASYICQRYKELFGKPIDEMKLHKLLYFVQRESLVQLGEPMFKEKFQAWRYGPVMVGISKRFKDGELTDVISEIDLKKYQGVFEKIFSHYAVMDSWSLSCLTHGELSWKKARHGIPEEESCTVFLDVEDIKKDAERIKIRRFLLKRAITNVQ